LIFIVYSLVAELHATDHFFSVGISDFQFYNHEDMVM